MGTENNNYYHFDKIFGPPLKFGNHHLIQIGRIYCKEGQGFDNHLHINWFELTIVTHGEGEIYTNDVPLHVKSGDIYLSFPEDIHKIISSKQHPLQYLYIAFYTDSEEYKSELENILASINDVKARIFTDEKIKNIVENGIAEFYYKEQEFSDRLMENIIEQTIIYIIRDFKEKTSYKLTDIDNRDILCYQIMNYIDSHTFELNNLSTLSEVFSYNYSYLSNLFKQYTNQTIQSYFNHNKLTKAKQLVTENKLSITEIAEILNFSSVYVFSKAYKKVYGVSPTKDLKSR